MASCGEDGGVRLWDRRLKRSRVAEIEPHKHADIARPKIGKWVGAVALSPEWIVSELNGSLFINLQ